eukprot:2848503-Lingulodinium_polyedra.AAC.1
MGTWRCSRSLSFSQIGGGSPSTVASCVANKTGCFGPRASSTRCERRGSVKCPRIRGPSRSAIGA